MNTENIINKIEIWPIERLIPYVANPRKHPKRQIDQLVANLEQFRALVPLMVDKHGTVIAGHARILAARKLGLTHLQVIVLDHLTESQTRALRLADNKSAENAGWDEDKLSAELAAVLEAEIDLTQLGFSEVELERVLGELNHQVGLTHEDAVPGVPKQPITLVGDEWILGDHRLRCDDATLLDGVKRFLEDREADLIFADFPYNVNYSGRRRSDAGSLRILNDNLGENFSKFLYDSCAVILAVAGGAVYICMGSSELHTLFQAFTAAGGHWSTFLIWAKDKFTLGRSDFHRQYEPILYGWREGHTHYWGGARDQGDVWFVNRPRVNDLHPTMKPVELIERAIVHSSRRGDLVLDPFAGSGSTLIACQKTGRRARLIELDPRYVDATITRWQAFTGEPARLASDGRSFEEVAQTRQGRPLLPREGESC